MSKIVVRHKHSGETAEVLGEFEDFYWLREADRTRPWTSPKTNWLEPVPEVGDIWGGATTREYRVLGVDEKRGFYLLVLKEDYDKGKWRGPDGGIWQHDAEAEFSRVFVRVLPEQHLHLKERPA